MPLVPRVVKTPLDAVGMARNFVDVMKELSFDDERRQAERQPHILIMTSDPEARSRIVRELTGMDASPAIVVSGLESNGRDIDHYDFVLVHSPGRYEDVDRIRRRSGKGGRHVIEIPSLLEPDWVEATCTALTRAEPDLAPALGRWYPPFRRAAVRAVIDETARVNAQFALISNAPSVIPVLGSLAAAGADFIVLTKNQLMMIFKLAAIHGRDLRDQWALMREMLPVVGAGLAWRTLAREAASFLPLAAGTVPRVAIAYSGTVAAGWAADFYYSFGTKPSDRQWRAYLEQAAGAVRSLPIGRSREEQATETILPGEIIDIPVTPVQPSSVND